MQLLKDKSCYTNVYESILRKTYRCSILLGEKFNLNEDEFIKLCLSDKKELCTFNDLISYWLFNSEHSYNDDNYHDNEFMQELFMSDDAYEKINNYLSNKFNIKDKSNNELLLANVLYIIENIDDKYGTYLSFFSKFPILQSYKKFLYLFSIIQITELLDSNDEGIFYFKPERLETFFFMHFKEFFNYVDKAEEVIKIIGEPIKEFFFAVFYSYLLNIKYNNDCYDTEEKLFLFIKHLDTYKWLEKEFRSKLNNNLDLLARKNIFYKEHAEYLSNLGNNDYLSKMTAAYIANSENCLIV